MLKLLVEGVAGLAALWGGSKLWNKVHQGAAPPVPGPVPVPPAPAPSPGVTPAAPPPTVAQLQASPTPGFVMQGTTGIGLAAGGAYGTGGAGDPNAIAILTSESAPVDTTIQNSTADVPTSDASSILSSLDF